MLESKLPSFEQLIFDVYIIYHTKKSCGTPSKLYEQIKNKYNLSDRHNTYFKYSSLLDLSNGDTKPQTNALRHCITDIIREILEKTNFLNSDYDENYSSKNFTIESLRTHKNYIVFLIAYLANSIFWHDKNFNLDNIINNIEQEFKNINKALYGDERDDFLYGLKNDLINTIKYKFHSKSSNHQSLLSSDIKDVATKELNIEKKLLQRLKSLNPTQFEHFALYLIASITKERDDDIANLITHNGQVGDGGIDGIVNIKTPLNDYEKYFIQCKRYDKTTIGRPELQAFVGSMVGYGANKGIFITTSNFTANALDYANNLQNYFIKTMNGNDLVKYMLEHKIGVIEESYFLLDNDFFNKFEG